jgi:hypothetical protein
MSGKTRWAFWAALFALTVGLGTAAAQEPQTARNRDEVRAQSRERLRLHEHRQFADRDGDGVCDQAQQRTMEQTRLRKGKLSQHRRGEASLARGFRHGAGGNAPANGQGGGR